EYAPRLHNVTIRVDHEIIRISSQRRQNPVAHRSPRPGVSTLLLAMPILATIVQYETQDIINQKAYHFKRWTPFLVCWPDGARPLSPARRTRLPTRGYQR